MENSTICKSGLFFLAEHTPVCLLEGAIPSLVENVHFQVHFYVLDLWETILLVLLVLPVSLVFPVNPVRILDLLFIFLFRLTDVLRCRPEAQHRGSQSLDFAGLSQIREIGVQQSLLSLDPLVGVVS